MKRTISKASMDGNRTKVTVRLESEPCENGSIEGRRQQVEMIRQLSDNIELMNCGFSPFQRLVMRHTGEAWLIEMEAVSSE